VCQTWDGRTNGQTSCNGIVRATVCIASRSKIGDVNPPSRYCDGRVLFLSPSHMVSVCPSLRMVRVTLPKDDDVPRRFIYCAAIILALECSRFTLRTQKSRNNFLAIIPRQNVRFTLSNDRNIPIPGAGMPAVHCLPIPFSVPFLDR